MLSITSAPFAFGKAKVVGRAFLAEGATVSLQTGTLTSVQFADVASGTVAKAVTLFALGKIVVPITALVTVWLLVVDFAFANASAREALSGGESRFALTRLTDVNGVNGTASWTEEAILALVTVDASRIVLTVQTNTATSFVPVNVRAETFFGGGLVEDTVLTVAIAVALLTDEWIVQCGPTPLVLVVPGTALVTLRATGVVLTATGDLVRVVRRALVAL